MTGEKQKSGTVLLRIFLCVVILATAAGGFVVLKKMKKPPTQVSKMEQALAVRAVQVHPVSVDVEVSGYGEVRSRTLVPLSAEVAGRVTSIHKRLEPGEIVRQGEVLLTIDDRDYRLDYESARERLSILQRDKALADREYERVRTLFENNKVGTLSSVEKSESSANVVADRISQLEQSMRLAKLRLERCVIRAPFTCRITEVQVEQEEYVTPGKKLLTIVNDEQLEVIVSLDSRDAVNWLQFDNEKPSAGNWFSTPVPVVCTITWTENMEARGRGRLDRVVRFDPQTRTMAVAIRLESRTSPSFPLVQGMFTEVIIPGRTIENVFTLPRQAVSYEGTVYVAVDNRLQTRPVSVVRYDRGRAIISTGLEDGDIVITTRLEQPLENSLLNVTMDREESK